MATAIIQARTASSRLPGKVILPLDSVPVIKHIIRRAQKAKRIQRVVVATTYHTRDDIVKEYAAECGANVYRGSEDDVLGRIYQAAKENKCTHIVRLTGDNPFVSPKLIDEVALRILEEKLDYVSNKENRTFPIGVDAEAVTTECLGEVHRVANSQYHREHALRFVRDEKNRFRTSNVKTNDVYDCSLSGVKEIRLTLDEPKDYKMYKKMLGSIDFDENTHIREIMREVKNKGLENINKDVEQKNL